MVLYLRYALELACVLPAAVFAFLPVRERLRARAGVVAAAGAAVLAIVAGGAWLCAGYGWDSNRVLLPCVPLFLAAYLAAVRLETAKKLFCFFTAAMLSAFCTMYTNYLAAPLETDGEPFTPASGVLCLTLAAAVGAIFWQTLTQRLPYLFAEERLEKAWRYFAAIPLLLAAFCFWVTPLHPSMVLLGRVREIALVVMLIVPLLFFAFCHLTWWLTKTLTESARLQAENDLLQIEQKRYAELRDYMDETRALRHDFRQHLAVIERLHAAGDDESLTAYLRQLHAAAEGGRKHYCDNLAVDALAAHYDALAAERDAEIEWALRLPETLPLTDAEYCAMFGNLLENALHAVAELPAERRRVRARAEIRRNGSLTLSVDNPYAGEVRLGTDGLPADKRPGHGVGLASVAATVHRCNGLLLLRTEGGVFSADVVLHAGRAGAGERGAGVSAKTE